MKKYKPIFVVVCILMILIASIDEYSTDKSEQNTEKIALETQNETDKEEEKERKAEEKEKKKAKKEAEKKEKKRARKEKKAKKEAEEKARKEAEEKAKKEAEEKARKEAEEKAKKEAEEKAEREAEEAQKAEQEIEESIIDDDGSGFWDDAKKFVENTVDAVKTGTEAVKGYSFKIYDEDYESSYVSSECYGYEADYDDFKFKQHIFKGYCECKMSVLTRNKIRKNIKKEFDYWLGAEDIRNGNYSDVLDVTVSDGLDKITFKVRHGEDYEIEQETGLLGDMLEDVILETVGHDYMSEILFDTEWYRRAYLYQYFNRKGGNLVKVEYIDADTGESLYIFK